MKVYYVSDFNRPFVLDKTKDSVFWLLKTAIPSLYKVEKDYKIVPSLSAWYMNLKGEVSRYDAGILDRCLQADIVVGFEIPIGFKFYLESIGCIYVNIEIHPYRFAEDLYFSLEINDKSLISRFYKIAASYSHFERQACVVRAITSNAQLDPHEAGDCLYCMQTNLDRSLFVQDRMALEEDKRGHFEACINSYSSVFLRRHPYEKIPKWALTEVKRGRVKIAKNGFYNLIASGAFSTVAAFSSSCLVEAEVFNLNVDRGVNSTSHYVFPDVDNQSSLDSTSVLCLSKVLFDSGLWKDLTLVPMAESLSPPNDGNLASLNLRKALGLEWGYRELDPIMRKIKSLEEDPSVLKRLYRLFHR